MNRIAGNVAVSLIGLVLFAGCRKQAVVEPNRLPTVAHAQEFSAAIEPFTTDLDRLLELLTERLSLMPAVARYKWEHHLPIEDVERERLLLSRCVEEARAHGLSENWSRQVLSAQIAAARRVQHDCFLKWQRSVPDPNEPILDLPTELRPQIELVTTELIETLARLEVHRTTISFREAFRLRAGMLIRHEAITDDIRNMATAPWREVVDQTANSDGSP